MSTQTEEKVTVHAHTFANPSPCALVGLCMACFTFFAMYSGKVSTEGLPLLAVWLVGGGLVQFPTGLMELRNGEFKGGNVFMVFGAFFMFTSALSMMTKYLLIQNAMPFDTHIEGWAWLALTIIILIWTPTYMRENSALLFYMLIFLDVALVVTVLADLGIANYKPVGAAAFLICGLIGCYLAGGSMVNTVFGRSIMPIPGPVLK